MGSEDAWGRRQGSTGIYRFPQIKSYMETKCHSPLNVMFFKLLYYVNFLKKSSEYPNTLKNHLLLPERDLNNILMFVIILVALGREGVGKFEVTSLISSVPGDEAGSLTAGHFLPLISTFLILMTPFPKVTFQFPPHLTLTSPCERSLFRQLVNNDAERWFNRGKETCRGSYLG